MKHFKIIFSVFMALILVPLNAQDELEDRLSAVEKAVSKLPRITGDFNFRYRYDDVNDINSFDLRRARLDFRGNISKSVDYRFHADIAVNARMMDGLVNWKINQYATLRAGQYKIPFSLESPYNAALLETTERALVIQGLVNYADVSGISANGRDIGVSLLGDFYKKEGYYLLNYYFGIFNGSGINRAVDENKAKDFSGIFSVNPIKPVTVALSYYNGGRIFEQDSILKRERLGFGARYDDGRLLVRAEYIMGTTVNPNVTSYKSDGYYALIGYFVHPKLQVLTRYDYLQKDLDDKNSARNDLTVGINYMPVNNLRLHLNYLLINEHDKDKGRDYIVAQLWIRF